MDIDLLLLLEFQVSPSLWQLPVCHLHSVWSCLYREMGLGSLQGGGIIRKGFSGRVAICRGAARSRRDGI